MRGLVERKYHDGFVQQTSQKHAGSQSFDSSMEPKTKNLRLKFDVHSVPSSPKSRLGSEKAHHIAVFNLETLIVIPQKFTKLRFSFKVRLKISQILGYQTPIDLERLLVSYLISSLLLIKVFSREPA